MNQPKPEKVGKHIQRLVSDDYYKQLIILRDLISGACDNFFRGKHAPRVDLYMLSKSVSSPMGKGSDSQPVKINFVNQSLNLVDSAQFGMEPLVINSFPLVYCYLPSFRGEAPDKYHLNQFYHCEAELRGGLFEAMDLATDLIFYILNTVIQKSSSLDKMMSKKQRSYLEEIVSCKKIPQVTFDDAVNILVKHGKAGLVDKRDYGRVLTKEGELALVELVTKNKYPLWLTYFDSGTVPFYQRPDPKDLGKSLTADLLFPSLDGKNGGEILGLGQRQNSSKEMLVTMKSQGIKNVADYTWYLELRDNKMYQTTSGFGLGVERLVSWIAGLNNITEASIYPIRVDLEISY